jgi:hypothetical protein
MFETSPLGEMLDSLIRNGVAAIGLWVFFILSLSETRCVIPEEDIRTY